MFLSRIGSWCAQRVSSFGLVALVFLLYLALWRDRPHNIPHHRNDPSFTPPGDRRPYEPKPITISQLIFVWYTIIAHVLALAFPVRLCWATWTLTKKLRKVLQQSRASFRFKSNYETTLDGREHTQEPFEDCSSSDASDIENKTAIGRGLENEFILHTIILPNYKEDIDTLRETLRVLACHPHASSTYEVYLAMESIEPGCQSKARILMEEFTEQFRNIEYTVHPQDIPCETQGKSSNLSWAAKHIQKKYEDYKTKRNITVTVLDADSHLSTNYFTSINEMHLRYPQTAENTMYVPPIIFDRNAHLVPTLVRVADLLWAGAGLSGHYESSSICPPTSVYSLPLSLVDRACGWDAGPEAIGEDLHMYIKCFFALNGNLMTRTIVSAVSQTNVHTGDRGIRGLYRDYNARYRQALRHMWGALDSGFVVKSVATMWWNSGRNSEKDRPHWTNTIVLLHRMYEAHFLPTHITLLIIGGSLFTLLVSTSRIPPLLLHALNITAYLRLFSLFNLGIFFLLYESYHVVCVTGREEEMFRAGLADRMNGSFSYRSFRKNFLDYVSFPVAGVAFGSVPTVVALVCHFWTLRLVYKVSKKPSWTKSLSA